MDKITMFLALKLYSHHQNKEIYIFSSVKQNNNHYLFFIYLCFPIKEELHFPELNFNFYFFNSSLKSFEKKEFQIIWLKLQRFNNTVEKVILN